MTAATAGVSIRPCDPHGQSHGPMRAINERLGFRVHREECTDPLGRETLGAFLRAVSSWRRRRAPQSINCPPSWKG